MDGEIMTPEEKRRQFAEGVADRFMKMGKELAGKGANREEIDEARVELIESAMNISDADDVNNGVVRIGAEEIKAIMDRVTALEVRVLRHGGHLSDLYSKITSVIAFPQVQERPAPNPTRVCSTCISFRIEKIASPSIKADDSGQRVAVGRCILRDLSGDSVYGTDSCPQWEVWAEDIEEGDRG
jgi:hypothetical protein